MQRDNPQLSEPDDRPMTHPAVAHGRVGVLLLNLGTPDATDYWSMRRYLKEFLSDRRVIEEPRWKWWPILNLIILTVRPGPKGRDYDAIWNTERNEGPLKTITRDQAEGLVAALANPRGEVVAVVAGKCWGVIAEHAAGVGGFGYDPLFVVPEYHASFGELSATVKNALSHRGRAMAQLRPLVRQFILAG